LVHFDLHQVRAADIKIGEIIDADKSDPVTLDEAGDQNSVTRGCSEEVLQLLCWPSLRSEQRIERGAVSLGSKYPHSVSQLNQGVDAGGLGVEEVRDRLLILEWRQQDRNSAELIPGDVEL